MDRDEQNSVASSSTGGSTSEATRFSRPAGLGEKSSLRKISYFMSESQGLRPINMNIRPGGKLGARKELPATKMPTVARRKKAGVRRPYSIAQLMSIRHLFIKFPSYLKTIATVVGQGLGAEFGRESITSITLPASSRPKIKAGMKSEINKTISKSPSDTAAQSSATASTSTEGASTQGPEKTANAATDKVDALNRPLSRSANAWGVNRNKAPIDIFKGKCRGMLNKITLDKFDTLSSQLVEFLQENAKKEEEIKMLVELLFFKTTLEHKFGELYAKLCRTLAQDLPIFPTSKEIDGTVVETTITFKKILLNHCQFEFQRGHVAPVFKDDMDEADRENVRIRQKKSIVGTIIFIGELFKVDLLPTKIILICIKKLTEGSGSRGATDDELVMLCTLLHTVGKKLDETADPTALRKRYAKLEMFTRDMGLAQRTRMLIQNMLQSRKLNWTTVNWEDKPQTLQEIRGQYGKPGGADSADEDGQGDILDAEGMIVEQKDGDSNFKALENTVYLARSNRYAKNIRRVEINTIEEDQGFTPAPYSTSEEVQIKKRQLLPSSRKVATVAAAADRPKEEKKVEEEKPPLPVAAAAGSTDSTAMTKKLIEKLFPEEGTGDVSEVIFTVKKYSESGFDPSSLCEQSVDKAVNKSDDERFIVNRLFVGMFKDETITKEQLLDGVGKLTEWISSYLVDAPLMHDYFATIFSGVIKEGYFDTLDVMELVKKDPEMNKVNTRRKRKLTECARFMAKLLKSLMDKEKVEKEFLLRGGMTIEKLVDNEEHRDFCIEEFQLETLFRE